MVLSDSTIKKLVEEQNLIENFDEDNLQAASYDLTVGKLEDKFTDTVIKPGEFRKISTKEKVNLPNDVAAFCRSKSSFARAGVSTGDFAGWIDPGFSGNITLSIYNYSKKDFDFKDVKDFAQIIFVPTDKATDGYDGNYQNSEGIVNSIFEKK